jgi:hypothetical protein
MSPDDILGSLIHDMIAWQAFVLAELTFDDNDRTAEAIRSNREILDETAQNSR